MSGLNFSSAILKRWIDGRSVSVGLEADSNRLPTRLQSMSASEGLFAFHRELIEATADLALAYKPQSAAFEVLGDDGLKQLRRTVELVRELAPTVPVILDAKRGDIGSTNHKYASAIFDHIGVDAVTLSPYLGSESIRPFLERGDKGIIILCRTSNPGASEVQDLQVDGRPLYEHIAHTVSSTWNANGNCGLVVGATYPSEMKQVRLAAPDLPILVPGVGAQGGDVAATVNAGKMKDRFGLIVHASRRLMYAFEDNPGEEVGRAARKEMLALEAEIAQALKPPTPLPTQGL